MGDTEHFNALCPSLRKRFEKLMKERRGIRVEEKCEILPFALVLWVLIFQLHLRLKRDFDGVVVKFLCSFTSIHHIGQKFLLVGRSGRQKNNAPGCVLLHGKIKTKNGQ